MCLTEDASFRDEYVFCIWDKTDLYLDKKILSLRIDWEKLTGICYMADSVSEEARTRLKELLLPLETHHRIEISFP